MVAHIGEDYDSIGLSTVCLVLIDLYRGVAFMILLHSNALLTKLRRDEIIVWCHVCAMNISIHNVGNREHYQDGDSVIKVYRPT